MYAIVRAGAKQQKVAVGDVIEIDKVTNGVGESVTLPVLLLVDGEQVTSGPDRLSGATVTARVIGEAKGPKIRGFTYKNKTNQRKRWGHRQKYTTIEVTSIALATPAAAAAPAAAEEGAS